MNRITASVTPQLYAVPLELRTPVRSPIVNKRLHSFGPVEWLYASW